MQQVPHFRVTNSRIDCSSQDFRTRSPWNLWWEISPGLPKPSSSSRFACRGVCKTIIPTAFFENFGSASAATLIWESFLRLLAHSIGRQHCKPNNQFDDKLSNVQTQAVSMYFLRPTSSISFATCWKRGACVQHGSATTLACLEISCHNKHTSEDSSKEFD